MLDGIFSKFRLFYIFAFFTTLSAIFILGLNRFCGHTDSQANFLSKDKLAVLLETILLIRGIYSDLLPLHLLYSLLSNH